MSEDSAEPHRGCGANRCCCYCCCYCCGQHTATRDGVQVATEQTMGPVACGHARLQRWAHGAWRRRKALIALLGSALLLSATLRL